MTLDQVQKIRDKYYQALMDLDLNLMDHEIGDAEYWNDQHRDSLQRAFAYWDALYNRKASAGARLRLGLKSV